MPYLRECARDWRVGLFLLNFYDFRDAANLAARPSGTPTCREASDRKVEFDVEFGDILQLERNESLGPNRRFRPACCWQCCRRVFVPWSSDQANRWHLLYAKQLRSLDPPVSCYHAAVAIEQERIVEPERWIVKFVS